MRMTIKDIARLSGCGVATVSRVLNHHPDVSEKTRGRVLAVVEKYGFQPNNNAKHLKQQVGTSIAILVKGTQNMLFADLVERVQAHLQERGRDGAVYYLDEEADEVSFAIRLCRERKPLGILFLGGDLEYFRTSFRQLKIPCVLLTNSARDLGFENLSSLTMDDEGAAFQAIDDLIQKGHREIGVLGGNWSSSQIGYRRLQGCVRAFEERGIPFDIQRQAEPSRYAMADAYAAAGRLLERCPRLTAIFAMSDVVAMGAIRAFTDLGKRVPQDISVVGCDGIAMARYFIPRLTTICQDTRSLAEQGVEVLLGNIQGSRGPVHKVVPFHMLEGESVARRNKNRERGRSK